MGLKRYRTYRTAGPKSAHRLAYEGIQMIATVPDLISVLDAQDGEAIGTPDYRYGLLVIVIGITGSDRWVYLNLSHRPACVYG